MAEKERPYQALRFVAHTFIGLGWLFILVGMTLSLVLYDRYFATAINETLSEDFNQGVANIISVALLFFQWLIIFVCGMFIVAAGQIYLVLLDIRDTNHLQKEYLRLLYKLQKIE
jgi:hypothetical protein